MLEVNFGMRDSNLKERLRRLTKLASSVRMLVVQVMTLMSMPMVELVHTSAVRSLL